MAGHSQSIMKIRFLLLLLSWYARESLAAQTDSVPVSRAGLTFIPTVGAASGAGYGYYDFALGGSVYIGRLELRGHYGLLGFPHACATIFPSKCSAGDGAYYDGSVGFRFPDRNRPAGAWTIGVGPGKADDKAVVTLGVTVGRDHPVGRRWLLRLELFGRHLFDDAYEDTWGSSHRQLGVRLGFGPWTRLD